jgi:hypothetical protein
VAPGGFDLAAISKRRRKGHLVVDDETEIPKEVYQGYVNDRSKITRKTLLDYSVLLPHYSESLPNFTTTFTDLCAPLCEQLTWATEVAEKRRRLAQEAEFAGIPPPSGFGTDVAAPPSATPLLSSPLSPLLEPIMDPDRAGLRSPEAPEPRAPSSPRMSEEEAMAAVVATEQLLVSNAPQSMDAVVTASMDEEDQAQNADARLGYSGRTEKMHKYLAGRFKDSGDERKLSYDGLCHSQAEGRKELIAGCFFELLVLRTNGVVNLQQEAPQGDIQISKANSWAKAK